MILTHAPAVVVEVVEVLDDISGASYADAQQKTQMNQLFENPLRPAMMRATLRMCS